MSTRWEVERAVFGSDLKAAGRHIALTLLAMSDPKTCVIPAEFTPSLSRLEQMTGLGRSTVARELNALERSGWVARTRPEVAKARSEKERTRYRLMIPKASATQGLARPDDAPMSSATQALASPTVGPELVPQRDWASATAGHKTDLSQTINQTSSGSSPERYVAEAVGAGPEEAAAIVKRIKKDKDPQNLAGFVRHMAKSGDLAEMLEEMRATAEKARVAATLALARRGPTCPHDVPGGLANHPTSGEPLCPVCRSALRWQSQNQGATA